MSTTEPTISSPLLLATGLSVGLSVCRAVCWSVCWSVYRSAGRSVGRSVALLVGLSVSRSVGRSVGPSGTMEKTSRSVTEFGQRLGWYVEVRFLSVAKGTKVLLSLKTSRNFHGPPEPISSLLFSGEVTALQKLAVPTMQNPKPLY